jgi:hypothetical protein
VGISRFAPFLYGPCNIQVIIVHTAFKTWKSGIKALLPPLPLSLPLP